MAQESRPTSNATCSCGRGRLRWEARQTHYRTRWLAICSDPECGQVVIPAVDGDGTAPGLEYFLLDEPPEHYKKPWVRMFLQASAIARWRGAERCPDCAGGALTFKTNLPMTRERPADPFEIVLCLDCGRTQISVWNPPGLHSTVLPGDAWEAPEDSILALKRAVRHRVGARTRNAE